MKATTLTSDTPAPIPPRAERETSDVSPADAAAFLATLATAIHAAAQPLSATNEHLLLGGTITDSAGGEGLFEAAVEDIIETAGETHVSGVHAKAEGGSSTLAIVPDKNTPVEPTRGNSSDDFVDRTVSLSARSSGAITPPRYDSASFGEEYIAPALLLPSRPPQLATSVPSAATFDQLSSAPPGAVALSASDENALPKDIALPTREPSGDAPQETVRPQAQNVPRGPTQEFRGQLPSKAKETLTTPQLSQLAAETMSRQDAQQIQLAERGAPSQEIRPPQAEPHVADAGELTALNPERTEPGPVDQSGGNGDIDQRGIEHSLVEHSLVEHSLVEHSPVESSLVESGPADLKLVDVHAAPLANQESAATTPLSAPEARPSSSSRLLEHLRASFPAAEVRISEGRAGETLVSMNHPDFGAIELNLQMTSGGIDIAARVDGAIAANLLRRSEASLRKTIHRRGLSLGRLRVERNQKHSSRRSKRGIDLEA